MEEWLKRGNINIRRNYKIKQLNLLKGCSAFREGFEKKNSETEGYHFDKYSKIRFFGQSLKIPLSKHLLLL